MSLKQMGFILSVLFIFSLKAVSLAVPPPSQEMSGQEKTREILEKERALRERIEKGEKVFIKKIIVSGITLIKEDEIKKIISPFKNHWLSKDEIQGILDSINVTYEQNGYYGKASKISYQIKKNSLKIIVEEKIKK
jgi:hemolysin activation/secretion protein